MKNKKLFAILTLVCFMFTLMPVAAFAGDAYVTVNGEDKDTVYVNKAVNVAVSTGSNYRFFAVNEAGELDQIAAAGAKTMSFDDVDTYKVYALAETDADAIAKATMSKADKLALLMEADSLVDDYAVVKVKASDLDYRISLVAAEKTTTVKTVKAYEEYDVTIAASEGWDEDGLITAKLEKTTDGKTYSNVKGEDLTFTTAGYVNVVTEDGKTTDRSGNVDFEVTSDRAGEYTMYVKYGNDAKVKLNVTVTTSTVADVEVVNVPNAPVNIDNNAVDADIEFKFVDAKGAAYTGSLVNNDGTNKYKIAVVSQPADSDMEGSDFGLKHEVKKDGDNEDDAKGVYTLTGKFEEEGKYAIKVSLENGASATAEVTVAEQGDIVAIKYDVMNTPVTVAYDSYTQVNKVIGVDANGVTGTIIGAEFSASGKAVKSFDGTDATLVTKDDEDLIGSQITVLAFYNDLVATTTLTVVDKAATINYGELNAEVGINNDFVGSVVDNEGKGSSVSVYNNVDAKALVVAKPENAVAIVDADMNSKGQVVLSFLASEAGEYEVQTIVTFEDANKAKHYVTSIDTVTVGAGAGTYDDIVVMSIGANKIVVNSEVKVIDAAPVVENNRTFVPFRALAEAFGATVAYDEATQSVTAELDGTTVVMTIGSAEYTVNGEVKTADVAPFINGSRTMVPVRFVAEAFGINVTAVYGDNGATVDVLFAK